MNLDAFEFISPDIGFGGGAIISPTEGGMYKWEGITSVTTPVTEEIHVFPNPATNFLRIDFPQSNNKAVAVKIHDTQGKLVQTALLPTGNPIPVHDQRTNR